MVLFGRIFYSSFRYLVIEIGGDASANSDCTDHPTVNYDWNSTLAYNESAWPKPYDTRRE
jgi:hypothetical protein